MWGRACRGVVSLRGRKCRYSRPATTVANPVTGAPGPAPPPGEESVSPPNHPEPVVRTFPARPHHQPTGTPGATGRHRMPTRRGSCASCWGGHKGLSGPSRPVIVRPQVVRHRLCRHSGIACAIAYAVRRQHPRPVARCLKYLRFRDDERWPKDHLPWRSRHDPTSSRGSNPGNSGLLPLDDRKSTMCGRGQPVADFFTSPFLTLEGISCPSRGFGPSETTGIGVFGVPCSRGSPCSSSPMSLDSGSGSAKYWNSP